MRRSTIGAAGLNFSVRDGKRWNPGAMATWICLDPSNGKRTRLSPGAASRGQDCMQDTPGGARKARRETLRRRKLSGY